MSIFTVSTNSTNFGIWYFYAEDSAGNKSEAISCILSIVDTFKNAADISNSYKATSWYKVSLPSRIFTVTGKDIAGNYTFGSYAAALSFTTAKETEYRCSIISGGWIYVSATNEGVAQFYTDKAALDIAINKYASSYISPVQKLSLDNNNYYTPVNNNNEIDSGALTRQQLQLPAFLSAYNGYRLYLCPSSFVFTKLVLSYANVPSGVRLTYLANDFQTVGQTIIQVSYDATIKAALQSASSYIQGYYLVTESDAAGNIERYLIYIDIEKPGATVDVIYGNNSGETVVFDEDYVAAYAGTFYFLSFNIARLLDNIDSSFLCVQIKRGTSLNNIYVIGDVLPVLDTSFGAGKYVITIYDRSFNALVFEVVIAGSPPIWNYTSLTNDTKLTITVSTAGDNNNAIVSLQLFKIQSDGTYVELFYDDDGTAVNFINLIYVLRTGGKYTIQLTDLFGRTVEMTPIFYQKELPTGILNGVGEGGRTNSDVTFKYSASNTLIVYVYVNNVKTVFINYTFIYQNSTNTYLITFAASAATSYEYLLFLYKSDDMGLFIEYRFEIDCVIGEVEIVNVNDIEIEYDGATTQSFFLTWTTDLSVRYYTASTVGGEMGASSYRKGTLLTTDGLYYFIVRDDVGNELRFTIYLKTKVAYSIAGDYITLPDRIASNNKLVITILESYTLFYVSGNTDYVFTNGNPILYDGIYVLTVIDNYGNTLILTIEINSALPTLTLIGVNNGGTTKNTVTLNFDDTVASAYIITSKGAVIEAVLNGAVFNGHGTYYLKVVDYVGNVSTAYFTIDLIVEYETNIKNNNLAVGKVSFKFLESLDIVTVRFNGGVIEHEESYLASAHIQFMP
ncbi:MAG: DUF4627 domain-containing protein [Clostridiales bacterium]|jgi:hypothetical protein|nr:DUF4627 domain-containing protein [Clostridiales bacterium]